MGMTNNNLCDSCTNIGCMFKSGIVRTECDFYMPLQLEPDNCGNYVVMQPPKEGLKDTSEKELAIIEEEYISKADYEARLKADMVAILTEIQLEIKEQLHDNPKEYGQTMYNNGLFNSYVLIQQKINALKENEDGNK